MTVTPGFFAAPARAGGVARSRDRPGGVIALLAALAIALLALLALTGAARAQTFPKFDGLVVDAANVLPPAVKADLTQKLAALQRDTKRQLVVATIPDLQGYPIEDYGYRLGRAWGVGLRDVNNGAILIVAPNDRKVRIEVGTGLEPYLTDALSSVIVNTDVLPRFKAGDLPGGIVAGVDAIATQLRASPDEAKARTDAAIAAFDKAHRAKRSGEVPIGLVFWGMVLLFVLLSLLRRGGRGQRYAGDGSGSGALPIILWSIANEIGRGSGGGWGGGGGGGDHSDDGWGGGGFSGGGGGSFGGGGASGDW